MKPKSKPAEPPRIKPPTAIGPRSGGAEVSAPHTAPIAPQKNESNEQTDAERLCLLVCFHRQFNAGVKFVKSRPPCGVCGLTSLLPRLLLRPLCGIRFVPRLLFRSLCGNQFINTVRGTFGVQRDLLNPGFKQRQTSYRAAGFDLTLGAAVLATKHLNAIRQSRSAPHFGQISGTTSIALPLSAEICVICGSRFTARGNPQIPQMGFVVHPNSTQRV